MRVVKDFIFMITKKEPNSRVNYVKQSIKLIEKCEITEEENKKNVKEFFDKLKKNEPSKKIFKELFKITKL